jgi:hypothetical protein
MSAVSAFMGLGFIYLLIAGAMNDAELPFVLVLLMGGVALLHFVAAKVIYDRRP